MVLKKLGPGLVEEMEAVVRFLAVEEEMRVIVEPDVWEGQFKDRTAHWTQRVMTYSQDDESRWGVCQSSRERGLCERGLFWSPANKFVLAMQNAWKGLSTVHPSSYHTCSPNL
jgi:hypothetical protein